MHACGSNFLPSPTTLPPQNIESVHGHRQANAGVRNKTKQSWGRTACVTRSSEDDTQEVRVTGDDDDKAGEEDDVLGPLATESNGQRRGTLEYIAQGFTSALQSMHQALQNGQERKSNTQAHNSHRGEISRVHSLRKLHPSSSHLLSMDVVRDAVNLSHMPTHRGHHAHSHRTHRTTRNTRQTHKAMDGQGDATDARPDNEDVADEKRSTVSSDTYDSEYSNDSESELEAIKHDLHEQLYWDLGVAEALTDIKKEQNMEQHDVTMWSKGGQVRDRNGRETLARVKRNASLYGDAMNAQRASMGKRSNEHDFPQLPPTRRVHFDGLANTADLARPRALIINPSTVIYQKWEQLVTAFIVYSSFAIPLFSCGLCEENAFWMSINCLADWIFVCDLVVNFRLSYEDELRDIVVTEPWYILRRYAGG